MPGSSGLCAIHQPNLLPRLSTLAKIYSADTWVVLDDVQFTRRDYQHRARLADLKDTGRQQWLSVPVHLPAGRSTRIREASIADVDVAVGRMRGLVQQYFRRSPHWPAVCEILDHTIDAIAAKSLSSTAEASTQALLRILRWDGTVVRSSDFTAHDGRTQRLVDLTAATGNSSYLCGTGGARYIDADLFSGQSISVAHFAPPSAADDVVWTESRKITALWALATFGPDHVREALTISASRYRSF